MADLQTMPDNGNQVLDWIKILQGGSSLLSGGKKTTTTTQGQQFSQEQMNSMLQSILEQTGGIADVAMGAHSAGGYNSSTNGLLMNDLMTRAAQRVAELNTTKTTQQTQKVAPQIGGANQLGQLLLLTQLGSKAYGTGKKIWDWAEGLGEGDQGFLNNFTNSIGYGQNTSDLSLGLQGPQADYLNSLASTNMMTENQPIARDAAAGVDNTGIALAGGSAAASGIGSALAAGGGEAGGSVIIADAATGAELASTGGSVPVALGAGGGGAAVGAGTGAGAAAGSTAAGTEAAAGSTASTVGTAAGYAGMAYNAYDAVTNYQDNKARSVGEGIGTGVGYYFGGSMGGAIGGQVGAIAGNFLGPTFAKIDDQVGQPLFDSLGEIVHGNVLNGIDDLGHNIADPLGIFSGGGVGGKIGGAIRDVGKSIGHALCFAAGNLIEMEDGTVKDVKDLDIGDVTYLGGLVLGVGRAVGSELYEYHGTKVTGSHVVFESGVWKQVFKSQQAKPLGISELVYPVITENHLLVCNGFISADVLISDDGYTHSDLDKIEKLNSDNVRNEELKRVLAEEFGV